MKHYKLLLMAVLLTVVGRTYADNLTVANVELKPGESKNVAISLENPTKKYTAFQFDLVLPEGVTVELKNNGKPKISLNEDRIDDHQLTVQDLGSNSYRLLCFSMTNAEFYGTSGALVNMTLQADASASVGTKQGQVKSQVFTETNGNQVKWDDVSFNISIAAAAVVPEITAEDKNREYGEENPAFTYTTTATLTGEPSLTTTATKTSPVGEYDIVVERGTVQGDYTSKNGKLTITKAPLTITAKSYSIKQGDALPAFEAEYAGFKNNETDAVLTKKPTITTTATSASAPGTYEIVVSGASAINYDITYVKGTLTITKADEVVVTAKSYSREYGEANPSFEYTTSGATLTGTPSISCDATATSPVGEYDIVVSKGSITNNNVTLVNGKLTVTKAPLTITAKSYTIKQGDALPTFEAEYSGFKNNETSSVLTTQPTFSCSATSTSAPGTYDIVVSGANATNYDITYKKGTLTIEGGINGVFYEFNGDEAIVVAGPYKYQGNVVIPASVNYNGKEYSVTSIGDYAFRGCSGLTSIEIPNSVTSIGNSAFYNCSGLTSITIPNSVTSIGGNAFRYCSGLTSVTIPNSVTSINSGAFEYCSGLIKVSINSNAIVSQNNSYIRDVFGTQVQEYIIGDEVQSIGNHAFDGCLGLTSITIPNSVTSFGNQAFRNCPSLTSITIPNSVTSIGENAFMSCKELSSVYIGSSVTSIGILAFADCNALSSISVSSNNTKYDSRENCNAIIETTSNRLVAGCKSTVIPSSVTSISYGAFYGCTGLTSIIIPGSVSFVVDYAFFNCTSLVSITIPNSVMDIGYYAFSGCSGLTSVEIYRKTPPTAYEKAFPTDDHAITLYVPKGSKTAYETANVWKDFSSIVEFGESEEPFTVTANDLTMVYGDAVPELTYKTEGGSFTGTPQITCEATSTSPVGTYTIIIGKGTIDSDNGTYVNGTLTITKAPLTITAKSYTIKQGESLPTFEAEYAGFKNNETSSVLTTQPTITTTATSASEPGIYDIVVSGAEATNYDITYVKGTLTISAVEVEPVTETGTTTFSEEVNENTDLSNTIIDNTYYTMNAENGDGYDATEQAIVLNSTTTAEQMNTVQNAQVGDATMQANYNGIVFEVPAGSGTITVEAKTIGSHVLNVQIGNGEPTKITKSERGTVDVPYNVTVPTYVYLYASTSGSSSAPKRAAAANSVLLYSYKVTVTVNGISVVTYDDLENAKWYTTDGLQLQGKPTKKGLYIVNGRKIVVK